MSILSSKIMDRDIMATYSSNHMKSGNVVNIRGRFPPPILWPLEHYSFHQTNTNGFKNLTSLNVPENVNTFLSYGPKFMLPAFSLSSVKDKDNIWNTILKMLENSGYTTIRYNFEHVELKNLFLQHIGDNYHISRQCRKLLSIAAETHEFLKQHKNETILVEGDKGKKIGLMWRDQFADLSDNFILDGIKSGQYIEHNPDDVSSFLSTTQTTYKNNVSTFISSMYHPNHVNLFYISKANPTPHESKFIQGMNAYVKRTLTKVEWNVPIYRPTLKLHKDPLKVRPVICKRHTPSISVGKVIRFVLGKIM